MKDNTLVIDLPKKIAILNSVVTFFDDHQWSYTRSDDQSILQMRYQGDNGDWLCTARVREDVGQFLFYSVLPMTVPPKKRQVMAEFLTRANFELLLGSFEMDFSDGEIILRTYGLANESGNLSLEVLRKLIFSNVFMMDKYLPGILSVMALDISPEDALHQISEKQPVLDAASS
jgi:hypothetical protein